MCLNGFPTWIYVYHVHAWCTQRSEEGDRGPGTGVTVAMSYHVGAENRTQEVFPSLHYCLEVFSRLSSLTAHTPSGYRLLYLSTLSWYFCHLPAAESCFFSIARPSISCPQNFPITPPPNPAYFKNLHLVLPKKLLVCSAVPSFFRAETGACLPRMFII